MATIGDLERKAGIGSSDVGRTAFWFQFHHLEGKACLDAGVAELKLMIAERNLTLLRAAKSKRQRWPVLSDDQELHYELMPPGMAVAGKASSTMSGWVGLLMTMAGYCAVFVTPMVPHRFNPTGCPRQNCAASPPGMQRPRT
ncbi:hypothetical protein [Rhizobium cauense]|uniref:hypothetical protein n=1 Tax=Rhizobium cauense TaxID=1166683 RepID=UPI001CB78327|nr:hypothetical protein [Rhizobium cauense]